MASSADFARNRSQSLPQELTGLGVLATDVRWSWNHGADVLWQMVDPEMWQATGNPWLVLEGASRQRLAELAQNHNFRLELQKQLLAREQYLSDPSWFEQTCKENIGTIAYFSMEFGLTEAIPIYSGGLGILAGDFLKTASDLGVPLVGIGLLYDRGYFRQALDAHNNQLSLYPNNDSRMMPLTPLRDETERHLRITVELPGRKLNLLTWVVQVGRVVLYLLDSNDPLNSAADRGITGELYGGTPEHRLQQEIALGVGGWRLLEELKIDCTVCHLNEGHAGFAALARIGSFMSRTGQPFAVALNAVRPGNLFTTHTPVAAAFDRFPEALARQYGEAYANTLGLDMQEFLALGRINPDDRTEPFNMAYLALHCSGQINAVSRLHADISRRLFESLFPRWPLEEIPVGYVTNGIHVPSWDSAQADEIWTKACGKGRWGGTLEGLEENLNCVSDEDLWTLRAKGREALVRFARERLIRQRAARGLDGYLQETQLLDDNVLTLGFARRFTNYKRPTLLLNDRARLTRILTDSSRPVQLLIAGKAHPADMEGLAMVREWADYAGTPEVFGRVIFLEDYDMAMAAELVQGVDLWINTPRRPWEACGTSGMKLLVNGGLNLSELDGWWAEAYSPEVGWALGDGREHSEPAWDAAEAEQLYTLIEREVVPLFYERDARGIPLGWVARMRASMAQLTARFSSNRMVREYTESYYIAAARELERRTASNGEAGQSLERWRRGLSEHWRTIHFGNMKVNRMDSTFTFDLQVYLGEIDPAGIEVQLWAQPQDGHPGATAMQRVEALAGARNGFLFRASVPATCSSDDYVPRIVPKVSGAAVPLEAPQILWFR